MFLPKTVEDDWFLFLLGLMQVLVGAVISQSDPVGHRAVRLGAAWRSGSSACSRSSAMRCGARTGSRPAVGAATRRDEPYPGLLNCRSSSRRSGSRLTTLALGGVIFLAMPRRPSMAADAAAATPLGAAPDRLRRRGPARPARRDPRERQRRDERRALRRAGRRGSRPPREPLWRGVTMATYENGRWHRQASATDVPATSPMPPTGGPARDDHPPADQARVERLAASCSASGRCSTPASDRPATSPSSTRSTGRSSGSDAARRDVRLRGRSPTPTRTCPSPARSTPGRSRPAEPLLERPRDRSRTGSGRSPSASSSDDPRPRTASTPAPGALERYLRDSGEFSYTLQHRRGRTRRSTRSLDFLVNRKEGHCEYFASALTLLLRSVGIPARMVNGFKGGDWNELAEVLNVRQKHAHSWVEAYLGEPARAATPIWITLDPTPAHRARRVGRAGRRVRARTSARSPTSSATSGSSTSSATTPSGRERLIYEPIRGSSSEARQGFAMMGDGRSETSGAEPAPLPDARVVHQRPRLLRLVRRPAARWSAWSAAGLWLWSPASGAGSAATGEDRPSLSAGAAHLPAARPVAGRVRPGAPARRDPARVRPPGHASS